MKVVAFLQNQWFKNPEKIAKMYARTGTTPEGRAQLNRIFLFYKSLTGKRIKAAFGQDACREIIWEEASREIAGESDGSFPADTSHIKAVIQHFEPDAILCFGKIVSDAVRVLMPRIPVIYGPHPAARHATVTAELRAMATELDSLPELFGRE
jgi:hypothetical protein